MTRKAFARTRKSSDFCSEIFFEIVSSSIWKDGRYTVV
jgi:hypothetical protein